MSGTNPEWERRKADAEEFVGEVLSELPSVEEFIGGTLRMIVRLHDIGEAAEEVGYLADDHPMRKAIIDYVADVSDLLEAMVTACVPGARMMPELGADVRRIVHTLARDEDLRRSHFFMRAHDIACRVPYPA